MQSIGHRLASAVNDFGIGGYVLDISGDSDCSEVRVITPIYDSEGRPALDESGHALARVLWVVPMASTKP